MRILRSGLWVIATLAIVLVTSLGARAPGSILVSTPAPGDTFTTGDTIFVAGSVRNFSGEPIGGVTVSGQLRDQSGVPVPGSQGGTLSQPSGVFTLSVQIPSTLPGGPYTVHVSSPNANISSADVSIRIVARYSSGVTPLLLGMLIAAVALSLVALFALFRATRPVPRPPPPGPGPQ